MMEEWISYHASLVISSAGRHRDQRTHRFDGLSIKIRRLPLALSISHFPTSSSSLIPPSFLTDTYNISMDPNDFNLLQVPTMSI